MEVEVIKNGTFGSFQPQEEVVVETVIQATPNAEEVKIEGEPPVVDEEGKLKPGAEPVTEPVIETPAVEAEANSSTFQFDFDEPTVETPATTEAEKPKSISWQEAIKTASKEDLYKELGLDPFLLELNEHIARGGKASDYLDAKAVDWNTVDDSDILRNELQKKYPQLTGKELSRMYNKKYGIDEFDEEDVKEDKEIALKADAYEIRQKRIAEQANFKIPEPAKNVSQDEFMQQMEASQKQAEQDYQNQMKFFTEHEATKNLLTSKRVAVNLGDDGVFNFNIDKPDVILKGITDANVWSRLTNNDKGEPDVAKLQRLVLHAANPDYEKVLVNYGKSLGRKELVSENQNAQRPVGGSIIQQSGAKVEVVNKNSQGFGGRN